MSAATHVFTAREAIDRLLREPERPSMKTLLMRSANVAKQIADLRRFAPWPALEHSLMNDLRRLTEVYEARGGDRLPPLVRAVLKGPTQ